MAANGLIIRMAGQVVLPIAKDAKSLSDGHVLLGGDRHTPFLCFPERFASLDIPWPRPACSYFEAETDGGDQYIMLDIGGCTVEVDPQVAADGSYLQGSVDIGEIESVIDLTDFAGTKGIKQADVHRAAGYAGARTNLRDGKIGEGDVSNVQAKSPSFPGWGERYVASELRWTLPARAEHKVYLHSGLRRHVLTLIGPSDGKAIVCYLTSFCGWPGLPGKDTIDFDAGRSLFPGLEKQGNFRFPDDLKFQDRHPGKPQCDPIRVTYA